MNWYPWLKKPYQKIIECHRNNQAHHATLIKAIHGMGDDVLIWRISRWLMCQHKKDFKSCNFCHGCNLMQANNHPDWYCIEAEKGKTSIGVESIRNIVEKFYHCSQLVGPKVVWLPDVSKLTEAAANALLKILEEPLTNCWFFLSAREFSFLPATLRSRCMVFNLFPPNEQFSLQWLQKKYAYPQETLRVALKLSNNAPIAAFTLLEPKNWQTRNILCKTLIDALHNNIMLLLPILNNDNVVQLLSWLISLLVDIIKIQHGAVKWISNSDYSNILIQIAQQFNKNVLNESVYQWINCLKQLQDVTSLDRELILTNCLLNWKRLLTYI